MAKTTRVQLTAKTWTLIDTAGSGVITATHPARYCVVTDNTPSLGHSLGAYDTLPYLLETG